MLYPRQGEREPRKLIHCKLQSTAAILVFCKHAADELYVTRRDVYAPAICFDTLRLALLTIHYCRGETVSSFEYKLRLRVV